MKRDLILAGVGGQGLLALTGVIGTAAVQRGLYLKQSEVHGMAQRGGGVQSHLRYSDQPVHSDLIPEGTADLILALEPMEALRYLPFLAPDGALVCSSAPVRNIPDYPDEQSLRAELEREAPLWMIDAAALAREAGTAQCANIVMLGAASRHLGLTAEELLGAVRAVFSPRGERIVETNITAFRLGVEAALQVG